MSNFKELRTSPKISKILGLPPKTEYNTEETGVSDHTWSQIDLPLTLPECSTGKKGLLIGLNPRTAEKNSTKKIEDEVADYIKQKALNPNVKHRNGIKDAIEPTRSNVIRDTLTLLEYPKDTLKKLITVDLFAKRTYDVNELIKKVDELTAKEIVGEKNKQYLIDEINDSDIIVLGWGNLVETFFNNDSITNYLDEVYNLLKHHIDKCYWYGATKNGFPIHPAATRKKRLTLIGENLKKAVTGK